MSKNLCFRVELNAIASSITEPYIPAIIPRDSITDLGAALMESERGEANATAINFTIVAEPKIKAFYTSHPDYEKIAVAVWEYDGWQPSNERCLFRGRMDAPPVVAIGADTTAYHCRAVGWLATYDALKLADPTAPPDEPYRDVYVTRLINAVLTAANYRGGARIETAPLDAAVPFCSRLFYPGKHRFTGGYNMADRITALCSDGTYLYLGVGHWLCRYDPATRDRVKLAVLRYTGKKFNLHDDQFRIKSLAYDAGTIYGWAESTFGNLFYDAAHIKISFTWAAGSTIPLTDANQIWNYDRGYYIKSSPEEKVNRGGPAGNVKADWFYHAIGEAMPPSNKTIGIPYDSDLYLTSLTKEVKPKDLIFLVQNRPATPFKIGDRVTLKHLGQVQDMGVINFLIKEQSQSTARAVGVTIPSRYTWPPGAGGTVFYWWTEVLPVQNLETAGLRNIKVTYDQPYAEGSATPIDVTVERRRMEIGRDNFYWPEILGTVSENQTLPAFTRYLALGECNMPEFYTIAGPDSFYRSEGVPPFNLYMEDVARFANLPVEGYSVENSKQPTGTTPAGHNRLMFNGTQVKISTEGGALLKTYGNIFLARDGAKIYCAFNRWRPVPTGDFYQLVWGELNGAVFTTFGTDRQGNNYHTQPPREITGFAHHKNKYWFGVKRIEPRWRDTGIQIIWAAPPQGDDKPSDYNGGLAFVCMVSYDKTEYLQPGKLFRVGTRNNPGHKVYLISEAASVPPKEITDLAHSYRTYGWEARTYFVAFQLEPYEPPTTYDQQAKWEMIGSIDGGYMTIMENYEITSEICSSGTNTLNVTHTATAPYRDDFEGKRYDYLKDEWHGEKLNAKLIDRMAEAELSEQRVVAGSVVVTLLNTKKKFTVTDYSNKLRGEIPVPPLGEAYLLRFGPCGFGDYGQAILYFNPVYANMTFDVEYDYYAETFYVEPFTYKGDLYFNAAAKESLSPAVIPSDVTPSPPGPLYRYNPAAPAADAWERIAAWPAAVATIALHGDDVYALAATDGALMRYSRRWPAYIEGPVGGYNDVDGFTILARAALAADCYVGEEAGTVVISPRLARAGVKVPPIRMFIYSETARPPTCDAVKVVYAGGVAYIGPYDIPDDNIRNVNAPFVTAYGHALILAQRYYDYYKNAVIYTMRLMHNDVLGLRIGQLFQVDTVAGRLLYWKIDGDEVAIKLEANTRQLASEKIPIAAAHV